MVRACRQPLTSSQDEVDALTLVMLAVELERKKSAFVSRRDALNGTDVDSTETTKATIVPEPRSHHEGLPSNPPKSQAVSWIPETGQYMQSQGSQLGGTGDTEVWTAKLMTQHELEQECLYRLWKASRINEKYVQMWAEALTELQTQADCDYCAWLMKNQPMLMPWVRSNGSSDNVLTKKATAWVTRQNINNIYAMDWSQVRRSEEGKYAVVDVISQIRKCNVQDASFYYYKLLSQEKVPDSKVENIGISAPGWCAKTKHTLVATEDEIFKIVETLQRSRKRRRDTSSASRSLQATLVHKHHLFKKAESQRPLRWTRSAWPTEIISRSKEA